MRPAGLQQEMWALLALYPALGIVITDAVETAQTLVTGARGVITGANELAEDIGHRLGKPARATPTTCLRPQGQIRATALEQALARQTLHCQRITKITTEIRQEHPPTAKRRRQSLITASGP